MDITFLLIEVISIITIPAIALMIVQIVLMLKSRNIFIKLIPVYIIGAMLIFVFGAGLFVEGWYAENMHILFLLFTSPFYISICLPWLVIAVKRYLAFKNKNYNKPYDDNDF